MFIFILNFLKQDNQIQYFFLHMYKTTGLLSLFFKATTSF